MKKGIACICLSALGFSLMAVFVRLADSFGEPLPAMQKAFFRNMIAAMVAFAVLWRSCRDGRIRIGDISSGDWAVLLARSVFGTLGIIANFHAISLIPLGDSMTLNKTAPFFTLIACWVLLGEKISFRQSVAVAIAFIGAMLVVKPSFAGARFADAAVGLSSGAFAGMAYALLHVLGRRKVDSAFIIFFFSVFSSLSTLPFVLAGEHPVSAMQILILSAAGVTAALGQFGITLAYRFAEPREIAIYDYCGIVFTMVFGFLVFGQVPDLSSIAGALIIVLMAAVVFRARI